MKTQPSFYQRVHDSGRRRNGFTLVELLVVITIIGAIAGLAIPAIQTVMRVARTRAMRAEMNNIEQGIDAYYTRNGDYPPDFMDWNIVKRHYLKIFPDIAQSELNLLYRLCDDVADNAAGQMTPNPLSNAYDPTVMDRAEAIVWALGGFSADPQYPFTGPGGPLIAIPPPAGVTPAADDPQYYEYNPTRNSPDVNFEPDRLSLFVFDPSQPKSFTNRNGSDDEPAARRPDVFPNYILRDEAAPVVYFDARTYASFITVGGSDQFNGYAGQIDGAWDAVRPVYSTTANNPPVPPPYGSLASAAQGWQFMNPKTFQLIAPGLDGRFGDVADLDGDDPTNTAPAYFQLDGGMIVLNATANAPLDLKSTAVSRFDVTAIMARSDNPFRDNMANFLAEGSFEDTLP